MKAKKGYKEQKGKTSTGRWLKRYFNKRTSKKFKKEKEMDEYKEKRADAQKDYTEKQIDPTAKEPTPQELQQKIYLETSKNKILNRQSHISLNRLSDTKRRTEKDSELSPVKKTIEPDTVAIIAAIEAGAPYIVLLDDGEQVTLHACKLSQPAILGLLVKFVSQLSAQA